MAISPASATFSVASSVSSTTALYDQPKIALWISPPLPSLSLMPVLLVSIKLPSLVPVPMKVTFETTGCVRGVASRLSFWFDHSKPKLPVAMSCWMYTYCRLPT